MIRADDIEFEDDLEPGVQYWEAWPAGVDQFLIRLTVKREDKWRPEQIEYLFTDKQRYYEEILYELFSSMQSDMVRLIRET